MISHQLLDAGLLQVGLFTEPTKPKTYRLRLDMLPCYPALFQQVVAGTVKHLSLYNFDYMLADADSAVIASAIAYQANCKLVYSRGRGEPTAIDLVGAYDVGHTALYITNSSDDITTEFAQRAARVGLNINTYAPLIQTSKSAEDVQVKGVYKLEQMVHDLENENRLPYKQVQAILQEIQSS